MLQGQTVRLEETRPQLFKAPSSQPVDLPFQKGTPIDPSSIKQDQELQDLCREILMVRISELHESDDDSMERLNLDDYNSNAREVLASTTGPASVRGVSSILSAVFP